MSCNSLSPGAGVGRKPQQLLLSFPGDWAHSGCIWELGGTHREAVGEYEHVPGPL